MQGVIGSPLHKAPVVQVWPRSALSLRHLQPRDVRAE